ncbi:MAG: hypothetical protein V8R59_15845 [Enterocloster sp.]
MKKRFKEMSLRSIIMILCSSFVSLIIVTSATFYITGISHINNLVKQNAANLTISGSRKYGQAFSEGKGFVLQQYYGILLFSENGSEYYGKQAADFGKALCGAGKKNPGLCKSEQAGCQRCYSYALQ